MKSIGAFSYLLFALVLIISCKKEPIKVQFDREAELKKVEYAISNTIGWFKDKDFNLLFSIVVNDSNYLSVHPTDNVVKGYEEFKENCEIFKDERFQYVRHELIDLKVSFSESGRVAWFYCILNDINEWDGQPANWENARWTGVLEKRNGNWNMMQQHFSFASE